MEEAKDEEHKIEYFIKFVSINVTGREDNIAAAKWTTSWDLFRFQGALSHAEEVESIATAGWLAFLLWARKW